MATPMKEATARVTFKEELINYLKSNGMFDDQAMAVFNRVETDEANRSMLGRWDESTEGYPAAMLAVLRLATNRAALQYIDEVIPLAWFRPMFTPNPEAEIARLQAEGSK